jgi:hypothetical protein
MPLVTTDTELYFHAQGVEGDLTVAGGQINANNGGLAWIFQAEEAAVITRISLRLSAMPNTPSSDLNVGLQPLGATGTPTGNWLVGAGGATNTTNFALEPGTSTGVKTYTLPASVTLTAGQVFAVVVRNDTTGWTGDLSFNFTHFTRASVGFPYTTRRASGVWQTKGNLMPSHVFYGTATKWYGHCGLSTVESAGTTPSGTTEYGWAITIPSGHPDVRLHAVHQKLTTFTAGASFNLVVRSTAGTSLATGSYDCDYTSPSGYYPCILNADIWLTSGTKYYLMFQASGGTTCPTPRIFTGFATAGMLSDVSDGVICNVVSYNGTTFTETTTARPVGTLIFNGLQYNQTGGTTQYIIPSGFNSIG